MENPQKLTQLSSRTHLRHLLGKRTAQKDTIIDITGDSQVNRAICGDFKPENFSAVQSIYAGFVERNIPAIPRPLSSRVARDFFMKKKENVCANKVLHSDCQWYLFEKIRPFCSSQSADPVCPKPTVPNPTYAVEM